MDSGQDEDENANDTQNSGQGVAVPFTSEGNGGVVESIGLPGSGDISSVDRPQDTQYSGQGVAVPSISEGNGANTACEDATHNSDSEYEDAENDHPLRNQEADSSSNNRHENKQLQSEAPRKCDLLTLHFVAVLRKEIQVGQQDQMDLVVRETEHQNTFKILYQLSMDLVGRYRDLGSVFICSLNITKEEAVHFSYNYCLRFNGKEINEEVGKSQSYRRLKCIGDTNKDLYMFDDICMKSQNWTIGQLWRPKSTKIEVLRFKFLKTVMLHLMDDAYVYLPDLEYTLACLIDCIKTRVICSADTGNTIHIHLKVVGQDLKNAIQEAIQIQHQNKPIQTVLVAAAIVLTHEVDLNTNSITAIVNILKNGVSLQCTLDIKASSYLANALQHIMAFPAARGSPALWLTALYHTISPSEYKQKPDIWPHTKSDLSEVVDKYLAKMNEKNQRDFSSAILKMFYPQQDDPNVLSKLSLSPEQLLEQLSKWLSNPNRIPWSDRVQTSGHWTTPYTLGASAFRSMGKVIGVVASTLKRYLDESLDEDTSDSYDDVKKEIPILMELTKNIIKHVIKDNRLEWVKENVYPVLHLLSAFTGCLNCFQGDECFLDQHQKIILPDMFNDIKTWVKVLFGKDLQLESWSKLLEISLPDMWIKCWENNLSMLFEERLQKAGDVNIVDTYARTSNNLPKALCDCLKTRITQAIRNLFGKGKGFPIHSSAPDTGYLIKIVSTSGKGGELMSLIIENMFEERQWHPDDYTYLLFNSQIIEVFKTLASKWMRTNKYEHLSAKAKSLIQNIQTFLKNLPEYILSKAISCKDMACIIEGKKQPNAYTILMEETHEYCRALLEAEKDFDYLDAVQENMRAFYKICQGSQVNIQSLESTMKLDIPNEERSMESILDMFSPKSPSGESTELGSIQMFENIGLLSESRYFKCIWRPLANNAQLSQFREVYDTVYKPAIREYEQTFEELRDRSMTLKDLENKMGSFMEKDYMKKEMNIMHRVFGKNTKARWIDDAQEHIKRYIDLRSAVENAKVINDLKNSLGLCGDFCEIGNVQVMTDKCLRDLTPEMQEVGETVKKLPPIVISFLEELNTCVERKFIAWIKEIIKDTGQLPVFVELASISAGENAMDIAKVCCFRDAISAAAPIIYGLTEDAGFTELQCAVKKVKLDLERDDKLTEKLRDSRKNKGWLKIAYDSHGSVERSSLRQATDINRTGIYTIKRPQGQTMVTLENCISLKCKEGSTDGKTNYRSYSLTELKELQNKLLLITTTDDSREDGITYYVEVLEHIINVGRSFLRLCDAGHILFTDWEMEAHCEQDRIFRIWMNFGVTNVEIKGQRPLLDELKGICESMQCCLSEWLKYVETKRNKYHALNYFTAKQLVNLCCSMAKVQHQDQISAELLNMLSILKEDITDDDVKEALTKALQTPVEHSGTQGSVQLRKFLNIYPDHIEYCTESGYTEEEIQAAIMFCEEKAYEKDTDSENTEEYRYLLITHMDEHQDDSDWVREWSEKYEKSRESVLDSQMKFKGGQFSDQVSSFSMKEEEVSTMFANLTRSDEKIAMLWNTYHNKLSGLVSDKFVDLDVLGETVHHVFNSVTATVQRKLPTGLERGKPNLISCKDDEMVSLCLSMYKDDDQPLPSFDEILICTPDTTAEEVELMLRRALQSQTSGRHVKIYSFLNAEKLNHEVSRKLESIFYKLSKTEDNSEPEKYMLIIFCDLKAHHSYVATAFDNYKRTLLETPNRNQEIKKYLKCQHQMHSEDGTEFEKLDAFRNFPERIKLVYSDNAGMGKTLYVKSLVNESNKELGKRGFTHKTIRLSESQLSPEHIIKQFQSYQDKPTDKTPRIFHFDMPPVVSKGLYSFLLQLFVLRCFQSPDGSFWRCSNSHVYLVEYTRRTNRDCDRHNTEISAKMEEAFLEMFPHVKCLSPIETQKHLSEGGNEDEECQLMDEGEFASEAYQRTYQYFKRYEQNHLEKFSFQPGSPEGSPKEWLECVMHYSDNRSPSWGELRNFTHFLNMQLKKCEQSTFCSDALREDLTGFKTFVVKFMITMSKDFSMRSLMTDDERSRVNAGEDSVLKEFQLRRRWEQQAHPYIMFNADNTSMSFLGFHIHNLDAIDVRTHEIVKEKVIDRLLFQQLKAQKVPFNIDFEKLKRVEQLDILSRVLGVNIEDPDDTYQLTLDNVMKILAIHLRFESDIPVIIMGETGCGKTRLVQFMCDLLRSGKQGQNIIVVRVHGGTTSDMIHKKVQEAVEISKRNEAQDMDTVLFFDEANTTEAINAIKEVICDKTINGEPIDACRLKIIAACNPYKKHSPKAIEQLEKAGLGYRVKMENTEEKLGKIPMRQLVYRVQPLPPSLAPLVWDFGKLNEKTQELYIQQMVKTFFCKEGLPNTYESLFTKVISASQKHMAESTDECRMVSLRDIERCMKTVKWFYQQKKSTLFSEMNKLLQHDGNTHALVRSLILGVGVCYMASLENRNEYLTKLEEIKEMKELSMSSQKMGDEINACKQVFIDHVDCTSHVAKNDALKENVFMMVVCMNLRIPLFLVGKPGSSKSLSKTIVAHAMQGKSSQNELFKGFKQAQLASFQCSPHSSPDGIISIFRQCAQFQTDKDLNEYVSVVVLDEIGLAEDSPKMPLKTLHPLLEFGCIDDETPEESKKVAFIGISNWSLDPAKMNRGILVLRTSPMPEELNSTALAICPLGQKYIRSEIESLLSTLTEFYQRVLDDQEKFTEFFGLRDFYSLVKLTVSYAVTKNERPSTEDLTKAVQRNFGGFDSIDILKIFWDTFHEKPEESDTISLLRENLEVDALGFTSRYLLLPTTNHAALQILKLHRIIHEDNTEVIFGSGFPHDEEYSQVCRTVNRVKMCMETGRSVILLNVQSLYESLYDALNQCYVKLGGSYYVDLGLGSHRVKCRVKDEFRLIVIEEKHTVYEQFPTPLLNRLEKHCLEISNILPPYAKYMQKELEDWLEALLKSDDQQQEPADITRKKHDAIVGYTEDTCASVLLQCCPDIVSQKWEDRDREEILDRAKEMLIQCATPDSLLRASRNAWGAHDSLLDIYFMKQSHTNMIAMLKKYRGDNADDARGLNLEVSTFSRLLNKKDLEQINNQLNLQEDDSCLYLLNEFYTEQSFSDTLRDFIVTDTASRKLVLLQSYFECPKPSQRLLFCVRHCITRLRRIMKDAAFDVVLITRLPRISGGCGYIASFGDDWKPLHLDELIPTPGFPGDIYQLQNRTVSEVLQCSSSCFENKDLERDRTLSDSEKEQVTLVDTLLLIRKSLQKGILQLQDKTDNMQRATKRIEILHGLLDSKYEVSEHFIRILQDRIISLLSEQITQDNWVIAQAFSEHFVAEGGSFRHMLWVHLEDAVASALAQVLSVIDGDNNLDNLISDQCPDMAKLWLKIFQVDEWNLLKIPPAKSSGKVYVVSTTALQDASRTCLFPFGWVLKERLHCLWSILTNVTGPSVYPQKEDMDKFEDLIPWQWMKDIRVKDELFACFSEDLVKMTMTGYPSQLNESFSATLLELTPRLYHDLTGEDMENASLPWLFIAYQYMQDNHLLLYNFYLQDNNLVAVGEATKALRKRIESLQPKEGILKDLTSCQNWLRSVKALSMTVELMLSETSLATRLQDNGESLITEIRLFWQSTKIMYFLMDHLLQNDHMETDMEQKQTKTKTEMQKKLLTLVVRNLIAMWKKLNEPETGSDMEHVIKKVTATLTKCGKNVCNIFMVKCGYCDKEFTEDDTAKVECGHMFHLSCLRHHQVKNCRTCKKEINTDYQPCGVVDKETFMNVNQFRRKCHSFFVEFMWNFVPTNAQLTDNIVEELLNYVRGPAIEETCMLSTDKIQGNPTLEVYLKPDSTTYSLVLKILLRCGMEESAPQLQRFIDAALNSNKEKTEELYFMVVRSLEDHIHSSNQGCLIQKAQECLSSCNFSKLNPDDVTAEDLHALAKLRFAVSVASDVLHNEAGVGDGHHGGAQPEQGGPQVGHARRQRTQEHHPLEMDETLDDTKGRQQLLQSLDDFITEYKNPWIQIYLLRNLCKTCGFKNIHHLCERFKWVYPDGNFTDQDTSEERIDPFFMYGDIYECLRLALLSMETSEKISEMKDVDTSSDYFPVCTALALFKQGSDISLLEKMTEGPCTDTECGNLVSIYKKMTESPLAELSPSLAEIVFHTVLVVQLSSAPEVKLLRTLCFSPENAKDFFLPTMTSSVYEVENWVKSTGETVWECKCGEPVIIGNCGRPWVTQKCIRCKQDVGGKLHKAVDGFKKIDKRRGHNLGDPDTQKDQEGERDLFGANFYLVRALIHSSLIWGTLDHFEEIKNIVHFESENVTKYLCRHLEKDIELLASSLGKSNEDAAIAVHFFLKHIMETKSDIHMEIHTTETEEKRMAWEASIYQKLQALFMDFEERFSSMHNNILQKGGWKTLAQIVFSPVPDMNDLPTTGIFNLPLMWRYEQRMTVQLLSHLIGQKGEWKNLPVLTELLKNAAHIRYIRYLPHVLSIQHTMTHHFRNEDLQCYENVSIDVFVEQKMHTDAEVNVLKDNVNILKTIWGHLTTSKDILMPDALLDKKKEDLKILDLLPTRDSVIYVVTRYLVTMQNDCINLANPKEDRYISTSEVRHSHVIKCNPEQDFLTIAMSNIDHVVEDDSESTNYNFKNLERQIVDRFFMEKPIIKVDTIPLFEYNSGTSLRAFFRKVEHHLEPLNNNDRNCILNDFRFLNEISAALSTLRIAIGFMQLSFPQPEEYLVTYLKKDLKLEDRTHTLGLPVLRTSRVKHIQSLWEVLSLRQSSLLIEMNQNPFFMIAPEFHEEFSEEEVDAIGPIGPILANLTNLDLFITEMHYTILNIDLKNVSHSWSIQETLEAFVDLGEINEKVLESVEPLPELKMKNSIAVWKMAIQMKRGLSA